jgi:hypothetical protein
MTIGTIIAVAVVVAERRASLRWWWSGSPIEASRLSVEHDGPAGSASASLSSSGHSKESLCGPGKYHGGSATSAQKGLALKSDATRL